MASAPPSLPGPAWYHTSPHGEESVASAPPSLHRPCLVPCLFGEEAVAPGSALATKALPGTKLMWVSPFTTLTSVSCSAGAHVFGDGE